jgi:putative phosphoribosyl transferase
MPFKNRVEAGRRLAGRLAHLQGSDTVVLGLPRGGVPVAFEVANALGVPLDVIVVRKLGAPFQPELAMGAVGEAGVLVLNLDIVRAAHVESDELAAGEQAARADVDRRVHTLRGTRPRVTLAGRTVVIVDDGVATGATVRAACQVARAEAAARVVVAVPVAPAQTVAALGKVADEVVCLESPTRLSSVGAWYDEFAQTGDDEVIALLGWATGEQPPTSAGIYPPERVGTGVTIPAGPVRLRGRLMVPSSPAASVVFAHGSGDGRHSPATSTWQAACTGPAWPRCCSTC